MRTRVHPWLIRALAAGLFFVQMNIAGADEKYPGTPDGAKALLKEFVKPGADQAALSKLLQPTADDYRRVFTADFAPKAEAYYTPLWNSGGAVIAPEARQSEIQLESSTVKEHKARIAGGTPASGPLLPVIDKFAVDDMTLYEFRFVEPGKTAGLRFGGLVFVNGHWRLFPKPARILQPPRS